MDNTQNTQTTSTSTQINITYETLFELLRREKNRSELQELNDSFYKDVLEYLEQKEEHYKKAEGNEKETLYKLLDNIKRLLKDLYQKREKKIIDLALISSRTSTSQDLNSALAEERNMYDHLLRIFKGYKENVLNNIVSGKNPVLPNFVKDKDESIEKDEAPAKESKFKIVRFLQPFPKFLDMDLNILGPFDKEEVAKLPTIIADILIKKKRVEEIKKD